MRAATLGWAVLVLWAGCGGPAPASPYGILVHAGLAPLSQAPAGISIISAALHLRNVTAFSDRSSADPRAKLASLDLAIGAGADGSLAMAPPGLYSGLEFAIGDASTDGIDIVGTFMSLPLHVTVSGGPLDVECSIPVSLGRGRQIELTLAADLSHWFDGLDLGKARTDPDDNGIIISDDDNAPLGQALVGNFSASLELGLRAGRRLKRDGAGARRARAPARRGPARPRVRRRGRTARSRRRRRAGRGCRLRG